MSGQLTGRVAIVTGASRGVGRAVCTTFVREGAHVIGVARTEEALNELTQELASYPGSFTARAADVTDKQSAQQIVRDTVEKYGRLDILVNNAGVGHFAPVAELSESDWDEMMNVNVKGPFLWTQAALPTFMEQRQGDIIFISSVAGTTTFPQGGGYCASKWGVMALADTLRQECKPYELRVTAICPGSIQTTFGGSPPKDYSLLPEDVAATVLHVVAAPRRVIYGTVVMRPRVPASRQ